MSDRRARSASSTWGSVASPTTGPPAAKKKQPPGPRGCEKRKAAAATRFGYAPDLDDATRLAAFRLRFRPRRSGPLDGTDMALIGDLAARFPVDRAPATA